MDNLLDTQRTLQKIRAVESLLKEHLPRNEESVYVAFDNRFHPLPDLLKDPLGLEKILDIIQKLSGRKITYKIEIGQHRIINYSASDPGPRMSAPKPVGVSIHIEDPSKLNEYINFVSEELRAASVKETISLKTFTPKFNDAENSISVGDRVCTLPNAKNEHMLCRTMFRASIGVSIDWSEIYEEMTGVNILRSNKKFQNQTRTIRDTMYAVNRRAMKDLNTSDELFSWTNKSVVRNF